MKTVTLSKANRQLERYVAEADREPVIITKNGRPCAAIVAVKGQNLEAFALSHSPKFMARLDRAVEEAQADGTPLSDIEAEL